VTSRQYQPLQLPSPLRHISEEPLLALLPPVGR
jgi:hypothetical protein